MKTIQEIILERAKEKAHEGEPPRFAEYIWLDELAEICSEPLELVSGEDLIKEARRWCDELIENKGCMDAQINCRTAGALMFHLKDYLAKKKEIK